MLYFVFVIYIIAVLYFLHFALYRKNDAKGAEEKDDREDTRDLAVREAEAWFLENKEEIEMKSVSGHILKGYKIVNPDSKKWFVVVHGYRCNALFMAPYCKVFYDLGFNIFAPDLIAHGNSGGHLIAMGGFDGEDLALWTQKLAREENPESIVLFGSSMGAATVINSLDKGHPAEVKAFIEDSGYLDLNDEFGFVLEYNYKVPRNFLIPAVSLFSKLIASYYFSEVNAEKALSETDLPGLVLHGTDDFVVPTYNSERIFNLINSAKKMHIFEEAEHTQAFYKYPEEYMAVVRDFLRELKQ